jgi:hypothetical protein
MNLQSENKTLIHEFEKFPKDDNLYKAFKVSDAKGGAP